MPVFETSFGGERRSSDGVVQKIPPRTGLQTIGPILKVAISVTKEQQDALSSEGKEVPEPVPGVALIDTGASMTAVDEGVCKRLGLEPTGLVNIIHPGGQEERP